MTLRPLFITRFGMFAFALIFLVAMGFEARAGREPLFVSASDVASFVLVLIALLWASWRNWRLGVKLSLSDVTVLGFFRDRTIPRSAVLDVAITSHLLWKDADERIRDTPIAAFMGTSGLAGVVVRHNERSLAVLRHELLGSETAENFDRNVEDRHYEPPTYLPDRKREGPPKHARAKKSGADALLGLMLVAGHVVVTIFAWWLVIEPALWLTGITETPGKLRLFYSSEPYSRTGAQGLLVPHVLLACIASAMTVRLLYFVFRTSK